VATQANVNSAGRWRWARWLLPLALAGSAAGCATWDEITSKDFHWKEVFHKKDPMAILEKDPDGDHRAWALRTLKEPLQNGGNSQEQDRVVTLLVNCATGDQQALCRLAAIETLSGFRDPRAAEGLTNAYYRASSFNPETAAILKCQTLEALGKTGQEGAVELLVKVLREPPVEGSEADKQQKTDERIVAARALAHFPNYQATEALVGVLRIDRDIALRNRARESLVALTGKDFPADAQPWDEYLHRPGNHDAFAEKPGLFDKFLRLTGATGKE
jgi:HEAT repeat protein